MKTQSVSSAVRRMSRRVVSPTLPRVRASFATIYRQCQPAKLAERLPSVQWSAPMRGVRGLLSKLAQLKMPRVRLPDVRLPKFELKRPGWLKVPTNPFKRSQTQADPSPLAMVLDGRVTEFSSRWMQRPLGR
jgi:hypothetical protein